MLAFNLINIDDTRIYKDSNKIKIIQELRKHVAILKLDKNNGIASLMLKTILILHILILLIIRRSKGVPDSSYLRYNNANEIITKLSKNTTTKK